MSELERIGRFPRANCGSTKGVSCWARRRAVSLYFCKGKFQVRGAEPNFCVVVLSCMIFDETMSEFRAAHEGILGLWVLGPVLLNYGLKA